MELHAFFDRDVFFKLACCDLWKETITSFNITHPYRLASCTPSSLKRLLKKLTFPLEIVNTVEARLDALCPTVEVLPVEWTMPASAHQLHNDLHAIPNMDIGEVLLTVVAITCPAENRLISGDKRFIRTLMDNRPLVYQDVAPRLVTFERCLTAIINTHDFEHVKSKVLPARACDGTLRAAFGSGVRTTRESCIAALSAYDCSIGTENTAIQAG